MMCGITGSGKTTFVVLQLEQQGFIRLSIDEEMWSTYGRYGIDYPIGKYELYKVEAEAKLRNKLVNLIHDKYQVVMDFSFWQRKRRNEYKSLIENAGWRVETYLFENPSE